MGYDGNFGNRNSTSKTGINANSSFGHILIDN